MAELTHMDELQAHTLSRPLKLPDCPKTLFKQLRASLIDAHNDELLKTPLAEIHSLIKLTSGPDKDEHVILGGAKNFKRDKRFPHFERHDGAWFDFAITVAKQRKGPLELIGYNFEIRFPDEYTPPFVRYDLNQPEHSNENRSLRAHLHPGNDDLLLPSTLMSPPELLKHFLYDLYVNRKPRSRKESPPA